MFSPKPRDFQDSVLFEATTGFFLRGQVSPPVEDVKIDLVDTKTGISRQTVHTSDQGTYKVQQFFPNHGDSLYMGETGSGLR